MAATSSLAWLVIGCEANGLFRRGEQSFQSSLSDAPNGKSSRLLTTVLTVESQPALTEVVVPSVRRIDLRCRPIESVGFQSRILAVLGAAAAEQRMKSRAASGHERLVCRFTLVLRILADPAVGLGQLPPFIVRRQSPPVSQ